MTHPIPTPPSPTRRPTDDQIARLAHTILCQRANLSRADERVVRDCQVLIGDLPPTREDPSAVLARVVAAFQKICAEADLDGTLHVLGTCCGPSSALGRTCPHCRGRVHAQPARGRVLERCERCDSHLWQPRGTLRTDAMLDDVGVAGSSVLGEIARGEPGRGQIRE